MKQRVISAVIALSICVPIIYVGDIYFKLLVIILAALGLREFLKINDSPNGIKLVSFISSMMIVYSNLDSKSFTNIFDINMVSIIFLIFCFLALLYHKTYTVDGTFKTLGYTLFLSLGFSLFPIIRNMCLPLFVYLFSITIFNDTFAHAIGTIMGRHKVNEISPNKSYEGYIGGIILGVILSTVMYLIVVNPYASILKITFITLVLSIVGHLGDLFFSQIKRNHNIKDFSNIMPGHGGILDRLDSIILVMLAFVYFSKLL